MPATASAGRTEYFAAARDILVTEGLSALKIVRLCTKLGVTSGSFYHHFDGWPAFTGSLLQQWADEQVEQADQWAGPGARPAEVLRRLAHTAPHRLEAEIRAWSRLDATAAAVLHRVDRARHVALRAVLHGALTDRAREDLFTGLALATLTGAQQLGDELGADAVPRLLTELGRLAGWREPKPGRGFPATV